MAGKSNYVESKLLDWEFRGVNMPTAPTPYLGLFQGDPTDAGGGGTEVTTSVRAAGRVDASGKFGTVTTAAGANTIANNAAIGFGAAASAVSGVTHAATFDAASGGNLLRVYALTGAPVNIALGADVSFPIGALAASED
jgi:hypothetical protein